MKEKIKKYIEKIKIKEIKGYSQEDWDKYFMKIAFLVRERSSCFHRKVGAVIVKNKRVLATGYNQPPSGFPHCDEIGCIRDDLNIKSGEHQEICYGLHAEQNALTQAARFGISTDGAYIYVTHQPCSVCARLIINAGIKRVVFVKSYPDPLSLFFFKVAKVEVVHMKDFKIDFGGVE